MKDQVTSIEQSRRLLELKDIAAYLPYGLKGKLDNRNSEDPRPLYPLNFVIARRCDKSGYSYELGDEGLVPVLRPMSDLTKEIAHRGEKITPLLVLANLSYPSDKWMIRGGIATTAELFDGEEFYYEDGDFVLSDRHYDGSSFAGMTSSPAELRNQVAIFDKLAEWLFDYRGLIPAGLAVDVNTLPENPYEV